jgi:hypothetical protein
MQTVIEVKYHRDIMMGGLVFHRFHQRFEGDIFEMHLGDIDDKGRSLLFRRRKQRA